MYNGNKYVRGVASNLSHLVVYRLVKKASRKSVKKKSKRKSVKKKSKRKCKHGRDPVSGKCRKKSGGNKGDLSRSKKDY